MAGSKGYLFQNDDGSYTGMVQRLGGATSVDLKTTGATTLYTVPAGKTLIITNLVSRITSSNTFATPATIRVGKSPSYTEYLSATALTGLNAAGMYFDLASATALSLHNTFAAGEVVSIDVTLGAGATTLTADFDLIGYLK
jgi:hypothetical protein